MQNVTNYQELIKFIINDLHEVSQEEIANRIGFAPKTLYSLLNGAQPGKKVRRQINGFVESKYGVTVKELMGDKIQIVKKQVFQISGDYIGGTLNEELRAKKIESPKNIENDDIKDYLLKRVIFLETELKKCKLENERLKEQ